MESAIRFAIVAASGVLLWELASLGLQTAEPWDSPGFWYAYLAAIGISALWGALFPRRAWLWGLAMIYAQAPVMWLHKGVGSMWLPGLILLGILSLPAVGAAKIASRIASARAADR